MFLYSFVNVKFISQSRFEEGGIRRRNQFPKKNKIKNNFDRAGSHFSRFETMKNTYIKNQLITFFFTLHFHQVLRNNPLHEDPLFLRLIKRAFLTCSVLINYLRWLTFQIS